MLRARLRLLGVLGVLVSVASLGAARPPAAAAATPTCLGKAATIVARPGVPTAGTDGPDVIVGTPGPDVIDGRGGADIICAGAGADRVRGGPGGDVIVLGRGRDTGWGGPGNDRIRGGAHDDVLLGGTGADVCKGDAGAARLAGCETAGGTALLTIADFAGTWDVTYSRPRVLVTLSPCADRSPELFSLGWYMYIDACGLSAYVGNFTPASFCESPHSAVACVYGFGAAGMELHQHAKGRFGFAHIGGYPLETTGFCFRPGAPFPGRWMVAVTGIDARNRATSFRWIQPTGDCRSVYGVLSGWGGSVDVTVVRQ